MDGSNTRNQPVAQARPLPPATRVGEYLVQINPDHRCTYCGGSVGARQSADGGCELECKECFAVVSHTVVAS